jgi:predicted DNA-binding transcriptional regulator YafY
MALSASLFRQHCFLQRLDKGPATLEQLADYYEQQCELHDYTFTFSKRTFLRDKDDILSIFKKEIRYNLQDRRYYVEEDPMTDSFGERVTDAYHTYLALNLADNISQHILFERRQPLGLANFHGLLHAIQKKLYVKFNYEKFLDHNITEREAIPFALKEFKSRWYLVCRDTNDQQTKTFALDRMSAVEVTKKKIKGELDFSVADYFQHCFGIIRPSEAQAQPAQIKLTFSQPLGKYIKSLPLHCSQQILTETEDELTISLLLYITHDLIMELLSYGHDVKVLEPLSLRKTLNTVLQKTDALYSE